MRKLCAWAKKTYPGMKLGLSTIFMATQSPIGVTGLPWKGELHYGGRTYTITKPAIPGWYLAKDMTTGEVAPADQFDKVLLVLEEWGQGDAETKRAGAELLNAGGAGEYYLPKGSWRLALSNSDVRDGITKEFDFVINRRNQLPITGDVEVWVDDYADLPQDDEAGRIWYVSPTTKAWALANPTIPLEPKPKEQGPWCTFRSLTMADRYAQIMAERNNGIMPVDNPGFVEAMAGTIGMGAAKSLIGFWQFRLELPSYEAVVADPTGTDVPERFDLRMLMCYELAGRCKPNDLEKVITYVKRIPLPDMQITFAASLLRRDYKSYLLHPAMAAWMQVNAQLVSMVAMVNANQ